MSEVSDEDLVRRFQRGDQTAFAEFVARHSDAVFRVAVLWLRDPSHADDLVQEVFLRSYKGLAKFRFRSKTMTWIYRVARNVSMEMNRRTAATTALGEEAMDGIVDSAPTAETERTLETTVARVRSLVQSLPQRQREVVSLRVFQELSVEETAAVMVCRPGTVKALLHQALGSLRQRVEDADVEIDGFDMAERRDVS